MMRANLLSRRMMVTSVQTSPPRPIEQRGWFTSGWGIGELMFIGGTGAFGLYEIYKGMFLMPQKAPTVEQIIIHVERTPDKPAESRWATELFRKGVKVMEPSSDSPRDPPRVDDIVA